MALRSPSFSNFLGFLGRAQLRVSEKQFVGTCSGLAFFRILFTSVEAFLFSLGSKRDGKRMSAEGPLIFSHSGELVEDLFPLGSLASYHIEKLTTRCFLLIVVLKA